MIVKRRAQMPNMEELISRISRKIDRPDLDIKTGSGLCIRPNAATKTRNGPMYIRNNWGQLHRILNIQKRILRIGGHSDHFSRKDRPNTGEQTPGMVRRHTNCHKRDKRTAQT